MGLDARTRNEIIISSFKSGRSCSEIADSFGISRQRVIQITQRAGLSASDGGIRVNVRLRQESAESSRDARYLAKYGHDFRSHQALLKVGRGSPRHLTPIGAYRNQRKNSSRRGIKWSLSLAEWWDIWSASGKWAQRGRERDRYVMSRFGDMGPYSARNVHIQLASENASDMSLHKMARQVVPDYHPGI